MIQLFTKRIFLTIGLTLLFTIGTFAAVWSVSQSAAAGLILILGLIKGMDFAERAAKYLLGAGRQIQWIDLHRYSLMVHAPDTEGGLCELLFETEGNAMLAFLNRRKHGIRCVLTRYQGFCLTESDGKDFDQALAKQKGPQ